MNLVVVDRMTEEAGAMVEADAFPKAVDRDLGRLTRGHEEIMISEVVVVACMRIVKTEHAER